MASLFSGYMPTVSKIEINGLVDQIAQKLVLKPDSKILSSIGNGSSGVFFLGEAAGPNDAKIGELFTGPFSQNFNNLLLPSVGLSRQNIYLTNLVKNSQPLGQNIPAGLIASWSPVIPLEIALIKPKLIVTLGKFAMEFFLPKAKISDVRGQIFEIQLFQDFTVPVLILIHPANSHRFPEQLPQIQKEFLLIQDFLSGKVKAKQTPIQFLNQNTNSQELF